MPSSAAAAPSSSLSPHATPFTLPPRPSGPPGRRQEGDVSRSMDDSFLMYGENGNSGNTYSLSPATSFGMEACNAVCPASWSGSPTEFYPAATCSTSGIVLAPSVTIAPTWKQQNSSILGSLKGNNGSKYTTLKTDSLENKTLETNTSSSSMMGKFAVTENAKSDKCAGKSVTFPRYLEPGNPIEGKVNSQNPTTCSKKANPVFNAKPLHIQSTCAPSGGSAADYMEQDPSECSVDSPCWKGVSASCLPSFDTVQTSASLPIAQDLEAPNAIGAGQKKCSRTAQYYEAPGVLQNVFTHENKQNHSQSQVDLGMVKKSGDVNTNHEKNFHEKELELAKHITAKCSAEQKWLLKCRENFMKQSGLNFAAPDFIPSSIGKSKLGKDSYSSTRRSIPGLLKAMQSLSEVLVNSFDDDEIELEENDRHLLGLVIENLQNCLHKTRKDPVKDVSKKSGLSAPNAQTVVSKSDARNYNISYTTDGGNSGIVADFAGSSNVFNNFGKLDCLTQVQTGQPSLNNFPKRISCEDEHSQVLVYKNLWIDAERANCELKYQLKHACMKTEIESSKPHIVAPRNTSLQVYDTSTDPSKSHSTNLACPPTLSFPKDHPTEETSVARNCQNLAYSGNCIHSGVRGVHRCSSTAEGYATLPRNLCGEHGHDGWQLVPNGVYRKSNTSASYIAGRDSNLLGDCEYGSSDWEHVLKKELRWS